jgi:rare lipoprotein A
MHSASIRALLLALSLLPLEVRAEPEHTPAQHQRASSWRTTVVRATDPDAVPAVRAWVTRLIARGARPIQSAAFTPPHHAVEGLASYYWQGQQTASGETFDRTAMTAAHRTLAFGTRVRVTNLGNGRSVLVRINDRGPFVPGRVIDLSDAAAEALGMRAQGLARVKIEIAD